ncbi:hypothetical protein KBB96_19555 [Luteolibacter ambystomatis]|uniref:Uncharacterized protein n=1 Tax=Luteolibacter ambystomatis TaxID=2824561 RepID=A0A975G8I2_9BACT|nr:hypothetical protein [Luteolibacter ambystomatis]QUE51039.1 hypothetical protein KBB96_19555 [Luteolibacter ambystomatis]
MLKGLVPFWVMSAVAGAAPSYTIVTSESSAADPGWKEVAAALEAKYPGATRVTWSKDVSDCLPELAKQHPRYVCFVSPLSEVSLDFVRHVHRLTRKFDADPFTDCRWGILTGFDAANALRIAKESTPLTIRQTLSGTDIATERCENARTFSELEAGKTVSKTAGADATTKTGPADSSFAIASVLEQPETNLFITSGHATERDWQIGYRYKNGVWKSKGGELFAINLQGEKKPIRSDSAKVYLPVGNCLMGHIDGPDAMALAFMNSAGVRQMTGYTLPTWYGYQGWGMLDYFVEQPGRYTMNEAFFANQNALVQRLRTYFPEVAGEDSDSPMGKIAKPIPVGAEAKEAGLTAQDAQGLLFDRDVVAFYGDPAWQARMAPGPLQWKETWTPDATGGRLEIKPLAGAASFKPVNENGSQRGGRPIVRFFEQRIDPASVVITEGADLKPVITDDFILVPLPKGDATDLKIAFTAKSL